MIAVTASRAPGLGRLQAAADRSVFDRLRLLLAAVFVGGAALALVAAYAFSTAAANETFDRLLISAAVQIAETVGVEDGQVIVTPPDAAFATLALAPQDRMFYAIRAPDGQVLSSSTNLPPTPTRRDLDHPKIDDVQIDGVSARQVSLGRYITRSDGAGWASIVVAQTRVERNALALRTMARTGALIIFISALGLFGALVAARRALLPLARIEQALAAREMNDVSPLDVTSPRETQALVDAINLVMARFADRMSKLHGFVGVAAHQIRTPIAALTAQVELLDNDKTAKARRVRVDRMRGRLAELGRLTNQLLGHAMIIYRAEAFPQGPVDLVDIARMALRDGVPLALDRDLVVALQAPDTPLIMQGDATNLREALTNLVNNAVVHGARSRLEVTVCQEGDWAAVRVVDDGPGIPEELWSAVLAPFAAPRSARAGASLGLSIVHEIAQAHGGRISFLHISDGFEVRMMLPLGDA
jgi:two-component system sensor histidine kinase TctE